MKKLMILFILSILFKGHAFAQWDQIQDNKFMSGNVSCFVESGPNILAATSGGIFRSSDTGVSWLLSNTGINGKSLSINYLCNFGTDVYIMTKQDGEVYKSSDNGLNWTPAAYDSLPNMYSRKAMGTTNNSLFKLIKFPNPDSAYIFYYSTNGVNWKMGQPTTLKSDQGIKLMPLNNNRTYIVSANEIWFSTDGTKGNRLSLNGLDSSNCNFSNYFSGEQTGKYLYTVSNNIVFRLNTDSTTWKPLSAPFNGKNIQFISSSDNILLAGTLDVSSAFTVETYRSTDHGNTWTKLANPNIKVPLFNELIQITANRYVANTVISEMVYSNDSGSIWSKSGEFQGFNTYNVVTSNHAILTFTEAYGILRSTNNGLSWAYSNTGLYYPFADTAICFINSLFKAGNSVFATVEKSPNGDTMLLYKSNNDGLNWTRITTIPNYKRMAFVGNNSNTIFMRFGTNISDPNLDKNNFYFSSSNEGASWQAISDSFFTSMNFKQATGLIGNGDSVLLIGELPNGDQTIYFSTDNGNKWTFNSTILGSVGAGIKKAYTKKSEQPVPIIGWGGKTNNRILAVLENHNVNSDTIIAFAGTTWASFAMTGLPYPLYISNIQYNRGFWYIATQNGVFASKDEGHSWSRKANSGLYVGMEVSSLAFDSNKLYLGTWGNGIWKTVHNQLDLGSDKQVCNGSYISLSAVTDGVQFNSWCCGLGTSSTVNFKTTVNRTYTASGTDNFNFPSFDTISVSINSSTFLTSFSASPRLFTSQPFMAAFTNNTPILKNYTYQWLFGDDSISTEPDPIHEYFFNGFYNVTLIATDKLTGCSDTSTRNKYIICSGGSSNPCFIQAKITYTGTPLICEGDSFLLTATVGTGYKYQWIYNNFAVPGANNYQFYAKGAGDYRVIINDAVCSRTSFSFILSLHPSLKPVIKTLGQIRPCSDDSMQLFINDVYSSYKWSTGDTTQGIWVKNSGSYFVTIENSIGCSVKSENFNINKSFLSIPEICLVTVDPRTFKNMVVWERPNTDLIKSYNIYKETNSAGIYSLIGTQPYDSMSVFIDMNCNPAIKSDRYKISLVDTCNVESGLSTAHMTINLQANMGTMGEKNLVWNKYEGLTFPSYNIYRGTSPSNIQLIATIASSYNSYTDTSKVPGLYFYKIALLKGDTCYPAITRAQTNSGPYSQSVSNLKDYSTTSSLYISADPPYINLREVAGSIAYIAVFTNYTTWNAFASDTSWMDIEKNSTSQTIKVTASSASDGRKGYITIKGNGADSFIIDVNQGLVGIQEKTAVNSLSVYPNPYSGSTNIVYNLIKPGNVRLEVYNMVGKKIAELYNGHQNAGSYSCRFSAGNTGLADGIYFVMFNLDNKTTVRKIVELR